MHFEHILIYCKKSLEIWLTQDKNFNKKSCLVFFKQETR
jgi:hypothetical protein